MIDYFIQQAHPEWHAMLRLALQTMDETYLRTLLESHVAADGGILPAPHVLFAAFKQPLSSTRYLLLGESPYPRIASANGYAFWDAAVHSLWSPTGLSRSVNRSTSLRNWLKMLLLARDDLAKDFSQAAIARLDKTHYWQTAEEFFTHLMQKGFLLLNASLVYSKGKVPYHAHHWRPFMECLFEQLALTRPDIQLILFGKIAERVIQSGLPVGLLAEHPYNISFITNPAVIAFFKPLDVLYKP